MRTQLHLWGNSLAIRIPKAFAIETNLAQGSLVELSVINGTLVISPVGYPEPTLDELLAGVTDENLHGDVDTGSAVGGEAW